MPFACEVVTLYAVSFPNVLYIVRKRYCMCKNCFRSTYDNILGKNKSPKSENKPSLILFRGTSYTATEIKWPKWYGFSGSIKLDEVLINLCNFRHLLHIGYLYAVHYWLLLRTTPSAVYCLLWAASCLLFTVRTWCLQDWPHLVSAYEHVLITLNLHARNAVNSTL